MKIVSLAFCLFVSSNALIFNCNFNDVSWTLIGSAYTCTASIQFVGDARNVTGVAGNHTAGRNNSHVSAVAMSSQLLTNGIPRNIYEFFPNLTVLSISTASLPRVSRLDLAPFPNLQVLILFNNRLEKLDGDLFTSTPSLQYINLSSNQIRHLGPNIFSPLNNLRTLRMVNNVCISEYVDNNMAEISVLRWEASFRCPASVPQIESEILSGDSFRSIIDSLSAQVAELESRIFELENPNVNVTRV